MKPLDVGDLALDRYRLTRILGEGGMGRVYLAEHVRLGTRVALKVLLQHETPDLRARFESEAELMARVRHPNVVSVLDYGETAEGFPVLAMEYVEGESLADWCTREGALDWTEVVPLLEQALLGLEAAHGLGIIHRDIKPPNILVNRIKPLQVKLADFGIAKRFGASKLTATGFIVGTPDYMAPEVMAGAVASVTSDIYSMASTLFELVAGQLPFEGLPPLARFERDAPRLIAAPGRTPVTRALAAAVQRGLARVAVNRFGSAEEMAGALRQCLREGRRGSIAHSPTEAAQSAADPSLSSFDAQTREVEIQVTSPGEPLGEDSAGISPPIFILVACLPSSRLVLLEERRHLAALVGANGRGYSLGAGIWFAVLSGNQAGSDALKLREALATRYGAMVRALIDRAPNNFRLTTGQLAGAAPLPPPLPDLISRVTQ